MENSMTPSDIKAIRKWKKLPPNIRSLLVSNVFCATCQLTTIVDYSIKEDRHGILLVGKCEKCGGPVARLIEDD